MDEAGARAVSAILYQLFRDYHANLRKQVTGLDRETLNWSPLPNANSIAVLVTHAIGSEREMLRAVRQVRMPRDRDAEFRAEAEAGHLLELIDAADKDLDEFLQAITPSDVTDLRPRGDRPPQPGLSWLVANYGHLREHLGQIELTRQLHDSRI